MIVRIIALVACLVGSAAAARPFTARDLAAIERVSDPRLSPDAKTVAINVRSTEYEENRSVNALRLIDRATGRTTIVVSGEKAATSPRWASDGRLYFLSGKSGTQQLWMRGTQGNVAQVTAFPLDVGAFRLAPDARSAVFVIDVRPECDTLACTRTAEDAKAKVKATGVLVPGSRPSRFWDAYDDGRSTGLFRIALGNDGAPAEAVALTKRWLADVPEKPGGDDSSITIARDGATVYFASRDSGAAQGDDTQTHLWAVAADGLGVPRRLIPASTTWDSQPVLSPDGRSIAYIAKAQNRIYTRTVPMLLDLASGRTRTVVPGSDLFLRKLAWSADGRTLLATGEAVGQVPLYAIDVARGTMRTLVASGQVSDFDVAGSATVYVADSLAGPGELFDLAASGTPRALTSVGAAIAATASPAAAEQFTFTGWNGGTVHGYVVKPQGYVAGRRYPVAFLIHGGPHGSFGNSWSYRWNPQV